MFLLALCRIWVHNPVIISSTLKLEMGMKPLFHKLENRSCFDASKNVTNNGSS